jgi:8-oxo-dGTP pyrophosphatase MutT (NUDIX family)
MPPQTIKPEQVDPAFVPDDYTSYKDRQAVRAIVFDAGKVALIHVSAHGYYMLPGGGVDKDEDMVAALQRELQEEMGVQANPGNQVGTIAVYFDRWKQKQTDHCFTAYASGSSEVGLPQPTQFEATEGHEVVWTDSVEAALQLIQSTSPANRDGKLIQARDSTFLQTLLDNCAHCYLFALEVVPLEVGAVYDELPLHCTLMHRFWTRLTPTELVAQTENVFRDTQPLSLKVTDTQCWGQNNCQWHC